MLGTHRLAYLSKPSARKRAAQAVNLPASPASHLATADREAEVVDCRQGAVADGEAHDFDGWGFDGWDLDGGRLGGGHGAAR